jgi:hypothetical protein
MCTLLSDGEKEWNKGGMTADFQVIRKCLPNQRFPVVSGFW